MFCLLFFFVIFLSTPSVWRATNYGRAIIRRLPKFLSTPSVWRATPLSLASAIVMASYFYPRPPCGGRLFFVNLIHIFIIFLSTPSVWRATDHRKFSINQSIISIHALRVEGDIRFIQFRSVPPKFLSTPSVWRATYGISGSSSRRMKFLSTPSVWRATQKRRNQAVVDVFLSTPSVWRATQDPRGADGL